VTENILKHWKSHSWKWKRNLAREQQHRNFGCPKKW